MFGKCVLRGVKLFLICVRPPFAAPCCLLLSKWPNRSNSIIVQNVHTEGKVFIVLQSFLNIHFSSAVLNELKRRTKNSFKNHIFCSFLLNWSLYSILFVIGHSTSRCANYIYDRIKEIFKFENMNIVSI